MPDVSDITSNAMQLARRKGKAPATPLKDLKDPKKMAAAGAAMMALPFAVRGERHRFKAYVEMEEQSDKGWRGTIKDGEVKRRTERRKATRR